MARPAPTTDKLRHDIDSGHMRDKVAGIDPAAAPLGTDDEAAGTPPAANKVERARAEELPEGPPRGSHDPAYSPGKLIYVVAVGIFAVALIGVALSVL